MKPTAGQATRTQARKSSLSGRQSTARVEVSSLLACMREAYLLLDQDGAILLANEAAGQFFIDSPDGLAGKKLADILSPSAAAELEVHLHQVDGTGRSAFELELPELQQWFAVRVVAGINRCELFLLPITEKKLTEEETRRLARVIEDTHEAIIVTDLHYRILSWNRAAEELYGWSAAEVTGKDLSEVIRSIFQEMISVTARHVLEGAGSYRVECLQYDRRGKELLIESRHAALTDSSGRAAGYVITNRDVTIRRRSEELLRKNEAEARQMADELLVSLAKMEAVIQNMTEGVVIADALGTVLVMNPAARRLYGLNLEGEINSTVRDLSHTYLTWYPDGSPLPPTEWPLVRAAQGDSVAHFEMRARRMDTGQSWSGLYSATPIRNQAGDIILIVQTVVDITEQQHKTQLKALMGQVANALLRLEDEQEMICVVTAQLGRFFHCRCCYMEEVPPEKTETRIYPGYAADGNVPCAPFPAGKIGAAWADLMEANQPAVVPDLAADQRAVEMQPFFAGAGITALLAIPWLKDGRWAATLVMGFDQAYEWTSEDISIIQSTADLAWLSIENRRLVESLRTAEERFRVALKNSPVGVYTNDLDLRYTWIYNPPAGFTVEQILGRRDEDLLAAKDAALLRQLKEEVLRTGHGLRREMIINIQNQPHIFDITIEPLLRPGGVLEGITVSVVDVSVQRSLENEIRQSAVRLELQRLILQDREKERVKIAQDLHDGPLQEVMALSFDLSEALQVDEKDARLVMMQELRAKMMNLGQDLRQFCAELRPPALTPFGLEKAIRSHIEQFSAKHTRLQVLPELMPDGQSLPETVRLAMFRVYQELLNNVARHARASVVHVRLTLDEAQAELEIQDNGAGFQLPEQWVDLARQGHFGLVGVQERISALGGRVLFRSKPGEGTLVRVIVPRQQNSFNEE